ncbi:allophanate hydrolase [Paraburkholderia caballeronis]|uniref:Allophanate hydrolase n=2 Tax=Paraburkholderia caballeronis TaxID=416943 RepID=A0A1H7G1P8_9BURK|nr:allophanate hydrolase [Paraburkholderia caballeronis]PXX00472.1 allophanate hydrolase [Paraburkholderia caballeronis]RAJ98535.1 allophanate hydrolase [Paraburkholderia caballeronis]SEE66274.1 allophanate hydrolase [Paraburkholderia caballeronis]SEK32273.1 allophanate hydrolase [Paraburkholderia caballeronis]
MPMNPPTAAAEAMSIASLRARYLDGSLTPAQLVDAIAARTAGDDPHHVWIRALTRDEMMRYADALADVDPASLPLFGIPFAIKDNIDLAGVPTTAACPAYAYTPEQSAPVVARLIAAGAIPVGKTNLDQFATGLSGQRSPYGACRNGLDPAYASGGSSSGSAVAVALGLASFSLGTDTAGSGRVPAAFHGLVGLKPTKGVLSTLGVVPACRSLDCVSIFAQTPDDAQRVFDSAHGVADGDPYARAWQPAAHAAGSLRGVRFGVPRADQLEFYGDTSYAAAFDAALAQLRAAGAELVEIDFEPFLATARLLYEGPWVAERLAAIREFFDAQPDALHPVTKQIVGGASRWSAADAFAAFDRLATLRMLAEPVWSQIDAIVTPTSATTATVAELEADPIGVNARFGYYTNFVNLLDLSALAVPAGVCTTGAHAGKPFGITFVARAHEDAKLLDFARAWLGESARPDASAVNAKAATDTVRVAVVGAHLAGEPLNGQLTERGARLVETTTTAPSYRLYLLPTTPAKPGLARVKEGGVAIEVEVWEMPSAAFGSFVALVPSPLAIGTLTLADGAPVHGFLCESIALDDAPDISAFGGWRAYRAHRATHEHADTAVSRSA